MIRSNRSYIQPQYHLLSWCLNWITIIVCHGQLRRVRIHADICSISGRASRRSEIDWSSISELRHQTCHLFLRHRRVAAAAHQTKLVISGKVVRNWGSWNDAQCQWYDYSMQKHRKWYERVCTVHTRSGDSHTFLALKVGRFSSNLHS